MTEKTKLVEECLQRAEEALQRAEKAPTAELKRAFIEIADEWAALAEFMIAQSRNGSS